MSRISIFGASVVTVVGVGVVVGGASVVVSPIHPELSKANRMMHRIIVFFLIVDTSEYP